MAAARRRGAGAGGGGGGGGGGRGGGGARSRPAQESMPSCESGYTYPEPNNHRFVWGTCYAAHVATFDEISRAAPIGEPVDAHARQRSGRPKYRCQWSPPLAIDWFDNSVYFGCQVIFRTRDRGQSWEVISPDLSTGDPSRIRFSGGVVGDNLGQFYGAVVSAIAPSRTQQGVIWAGTNDGKVWISRDAGKKWIDLTKNVNMPPWGLVRRIDASHFDPGTAYMAVDYHLVDNRDPYLFKTTDFGQTWTRIDGGLPKGHPLDYALSIAENPHRKRMIFAGTGHGFFYSRDDGKTWTQFKDKLPAAPVNWIEVPKNARGSRGRDLRPRPLDPARHLAARAGRSAPMQQPRRAAAATSRCPATAHGSGGTATFVFSLRSRRRRRRSRSRFSAPTARCISTSEVHGPRRAQPGVVESAVSGAGAAGAAVDSARQSAHLGGRPLAGPRAAGHALGPRRAATGSRARRRASTPCA